METPNITYGTRDRLGLFGQRESRINAQWLTLLGARYERVKTDAGNVRGYDQNTNGMGMMVNNQNNDAAAFNAQDRERTDNNWGLTGLARCTPDANSDLEFGIARKVRSPNLYERYTWSMAAVMNNLVGDGNGYFGNINLKPEPAHTVSATLDLYAADRRWEQLRVTPYYTRVTDYIDAIRCPVGASCALANRTTTNQFIVLQYANQSAELYGLDVSARMPIASLACSPTLTARTAIPATTSCRSIVSSREVAEKARSRLRRKTTCPTCATKPRQRVTG